MFYKCPLALVLLALVSCTQASVQASELIFTLQGVTFEDAASASGFFQFAGPWSVSVQAGDHFTAFDYTPNNSRILPVQDATVLVWYVAANDGERGLRLRFPKPNGGVAKPGDVLPLIVADSSTPSNLASWEVLPRTNTSRNITGGSILVTEAVIPEMSTVAFLGLALLLAAACRWVQR